MRNNMLWILILVALIGIVTTLAFVRTDIFFGREEAMETPTLPSPVVEEVTPPEEVSEEVSSEVVDDTKTTIGTSYESRDIVAYHYGSGEKELLLVGGIHGGYSWNTSALAYELMAHFEKTPESIPAGVRVTVIPVLNPDGLAKVVSTEGSFAQSDVRNVDTKPGRFNARSVDLNRNFDCDWSESGMWQNTRVSGGSSAFSEPETKAVREYIKQHTPDAVVVWYSAEGAVYGSSCNGGVASETKTLMNTFATASRYPARDTFTSYAVNGDMTNWLAKEKISAIGVLLSDHTGTEYDRNRSGVEALIRHLAQ